MSEIPLYVVQRQGISAYNLHMLQRDLTQYLAQYKPGTGVVGFFECESTISFGNATRRNSLKPGSQTDVDSRIESFFQTDLYFPDSGLIPFIKSERGGGSTYLGPGQRTIFFILPMVEETVAGFDSFVNSFLETTVKDATKNDQIISVPKKDLIYVDEHGLEYKLASKGLSFKLYNNRLYSQFGVSIHVLRDSVEGFARVNPCGFENLLVTSCQDLNSLVTMESFDTGAYNYLSKHFSKLIRPGSPANYMQKNVDNYLSGL
ncbi:MAG: lipoyl protein ligase domain-containing protein [Candidatus Woesearchaeota archaeon]